MVHLVANHWRSVVVTAGTLSARSAARHVPAVAILSLPLIIAGCFLFRPMELTPSVVGVIASSENTTGVWRYVLESGESVEIDFDQTSTLAGARGGGPGSLLFYGEEPDPWHFTLEESAPDELPGCYWWQAVGVDDDTHIVFENGLRLPKAPDFDGQSWPQDGRYDLPVPGGDVAPFCMNQRGEVAAYLARP